MSGIFNVISGKKSYMVIGAFVVYIIVQAVNGQELDETMLASFTAAYAAALRLAVQKSTPAS